MKEKLIILLDPSVASNNLGDEIIAEAVLSNLREVFSNDRIVRVQSREITKWSASLLRQADLVFFGGSNAFSSNPVFGYRQLAKNLFGWLNLINIIPIGVGWWQYQSSESIFTKGYYNKILSKEYILSVRDDYSRSKLAELGFAVLNTGCPTTWNLKPYNAKNSSKVVFTLTDYSPNPSRDTAILDSIFNTYSDINFWPQGINDTLYLKTLVDDDRFNEINILGPILDSFDEAVQDASYYGTRLHAGVRALQFTRPSYIIPIDNRSMEMATNLDLNLVSSFDTVNLTGDFSFKGVSEDILRSKTLFLNQFSN